MKLRTHLPWVALVLVTGVVLAGREFVGPVGADAVRTAPPVVTAIAPQRPLPTATLALAFGFQTAGQPASSRSDITLKASFVSSQGDARALVKSASGEGVYRVGDRLPGGGVLRRIDVRSVVLWVDGREEVVSLSATPPSVFLPMGAVVDSRQVPDSSPRLLREVQ